MGLPAVLSAARGGVAGEGLPGLDRHRSQRDAQGFSSMDAGHRRPPAQRTGPSATRCGSGQTRGLGVAMRHRSGTLVLDALAVVARMGPVLPLQTSTAPAILLAHLPRCAPSRTWLAVPPLLSFLFRPWAAAVLSITVAAVALLLPMISRCFSVHRCWY